ncbi:MAG: TIGR04086 family membrane protein [Clostridia bacterium]|nr:TIGR04086 family membrane protein [Clostridia bacterium]
MQQNDKKQYQQILKGALYGSLLLVIIIFIFTLILYKAVITEKAYLPLMLLCIIISGFVSGYISTRKYRKNGMITGGVSTTISVIMLLIIMIIANKSFDIYMIIPEIIMIISGISGGIAAVNIKRRIKRR